MKDKRKKPRPWDRTPSDMPDVIWGGVHGDNPTLDVTRQKYRDPVTGMPASTLPTGPEL